jgi:hypothetical protein
MVYCSINVYSSLFLVFLHERKVLPTWISTFLISPELRSF